MRLNHVFHKQEIVLLNVSRKNVDAEFIRKMFKHSVLLSK